MLREVGGFSSVLRPNLGFAEMIVQRRGTSSNLYNTNKSQKRLHLLLRFESQNDPTFRYSLKIIFGFTTVPYSRTSPKNFGGNNFLHEFYCRLLES